MSLPALAGSPLSCSNIYGITSDATNTLLKTFDPITGTVTDVATMGAAASAFTLGIDPSSGRVYYVSNSGTSIHHIFIYDPITGLTTDTGTVVPIASGVNALQLGLDQTGVGYVVDANFNAWSFTATTTPVVTSLGLISGMSGYNGGDIAFDSNNVGWTVSRNTTNGNYTLFRVTKSGNTLTATKVGDLQEGGASVTNASNIGSVAFDPAGNLYIVRSSDGHSWKIDPKTAIATTIANSITPNGNGIADFATCAIPTIVINPITVSGNVFHDRDADVVINGTDAGTNAGSSTLTIYAVDSTGKVLDKASVAANGAYSLTKIPQNSSIKLRLSNDNTVGIGIIAPTTPSIPSGWYYTGENLNGTIDPVIATLGDIALTTTTVNLTNENFGIRQGTTLVADPAPTVCSVDYRTTLNTGVTAAGTQLAVGANDLNWTAEWIAGPPGTANSPVGTPYAPPRPVGTMPAVVIGNLAAGAWVNEPANARWISYPFRLSTNSNGTHRDADLDGKNGEDGSGIAIVGTSDAVRLKFTSQLTLPSNAATTSITLPIGAAMDNQFVSIKVNGVENLSPVPTPNSQAANYSAFTNVNLTQGWQAGVNTIEVVMDSGPPQAGFLLTVNAATTQTCSVANVSISGKVWNDKDASGTPTFTNINTNGEVGTNAVFGTTTVPVNAILVDATTNKVLATQVVGTDGTYSFAGVSANTNVKIILSPTAGTVAATPPTAVAPTGWVGTSPIDSGIFNTGAAAITSKDFGIRQKAKLVLLKRITKINGQTTNPNDGTVLNAPTTDTLNVGVNNWPTNYLFGTTSAGKIKPGDAIEYTIYFLNNQGADATTVKMCDPIRGAQVYLANSLQLQLGSGTITAQTDAPDLTDSGHSYLTGNTPANCNAAATTSVGADNGGVAIGIPGVDATLPPIPGAIGSGNPSASYGLFRFVTQVKP